MSKVKRVFITGANRGIGFYLLKELVSKLKPTQVFATFRNVGQSKELHEFAKSNPSVHLIQLDVREESKFDQMLTNVKEATKGEGINLLINNAGITSKYAKLNAVKKESLLENFEVNTVAPILITKTLLPLLERAADTSSETEYGISRSAVVNISSLLGSISANDNGGMYPYRCSKAALNMATKSMSLDFRKHKILAVAIHPGWVSTDMGGVKAPLTPQQSAQDLLALIQSLNEEHNGNFYQFDGTKLEW